MNVRVCSAFVLLVGVFAGDARTSEPPPFAELVGHQVKLKAGLEGVHPRVFVTEAGLETLRQRARTTHKAEWERVLARLAALQSNPPPPPGPQARRSQNVVAFTIAEAALAWQIDRRPEHLAAARRWMLAATDYEPWGYTNYKPNVDLAAGHLLYAVGWGYDLLYHELTVEERSRIRHSLERHARLVHDYFSPASGRRFTFTQNHNYIPTAGLAVAALALFDEVADAPRWAALARAHHHRAGTLLSPDGYFYESMEYWIFSAPWLVHFLDAWEHATGESLWEQAPFRNWKYYLAHVLLPDGQNVFDFGDVWEGALTRSGKGQEYARVFPGGTLQSNYNVLYRVAARFRDVEAQAVADRFRAFGHSNLEEFWTLLWRDADLAPAAIDRLPLFHHFEDSGVVFGRTSWTPEATAFAFKAGPPEGHRVASLLPRLPEWRLDSGHAHPDGGSFIIYADRRYLTGDTGYAGLPEARHHNTVTIDGVGQGKSGKHDAWAGMDYGRLSRARILGASFTSHSARLVAELSGLYPEATGLQHFQRTFTFEAPARFQIEDELKTARPATFQWFLQSDVPFTGEAARWQAADRDAVLTVSVDASADTSAASAPTVLTAPGRPGAITEGTQDVRGYHLEVATKQPATALTLRVSLQSDQRQSSR